MGIGFKCERWVQVWVLDLATVLVGLGLNMGIGFKYEFWVQVWVLDLRMVLGSSTGIGPNCGMVVDMGGTSWTSPRWSARTCSAASSSTLS